MKGFRTPLFLCIPLLLSLQGLREPSASRRLQAPLKHAAISIVSVRPLQGNVFVAVGSELLEGRGERSIILRSNDGGHTWERGPTVPRGWFYDIFFIDGQTGWVCGYRGLVLKTTDAGTTWATQRTSLRVPLMRVLFINKDQGWAMSEERHILRTTDGG